MDNNHSHICLLRQHSTLLGNRVGGFPLHHKVPSRFRQQGCWCPVVDIDGTVHVWMRNRGNAWMDPRNNRSSKWLTWREDSLANRTVHRGRQTETNIPEAQCRVQRGEKTTILEGWFSTKKAATSPPGKMGIEQPLQFCPFAFWDTSKWILRWRNLVKVTKRHGVVARKFVDVLADIWFALNEDEFLSYRAFSTCASKVRTTARNLQ